MSAAATSRRIRALRPPRPAVDAWRAHGSLVEDERRPDGRVERALTVFLAGAECPFTCSFCDLWRWTLDGPTPVGALPAQLEGELRSSGGGAGADRLKLYNASNFFDARAVPPADLPRLAELAAPFGGVTVESHVSTVGPAARAFDATLAGRLEVAMGLETIHPAAARSMNKRLDPDAFARAAGYLRDHDVDVRAFVLLGMPHVPAGESVAWTVRTVEFAARAGAATIAIIPVRGGNGETDRLQSLRLFTPPTLADLEAALDGAVGTAGAAVSADLWDASRLAACERCRDARVARLGRINLTGALDPRVACDACDASPVEATRS